MRLRRTLTPTQLRSFFNEWLTLGLDKRSVRQYICCWRLSESRLPVPADRIRFRVSERCGTTIQRASPDAVRLDYRRTASSLTIEPSDGQATGPALAADSSSLALSVVIPPGNVPRLLKAKSAKNPEQMSNRLDFVHSGVLYPEKSPCFSAFTPHKNRRTAIRSIRVWPLLNSRVQKYKPVRKRLVLRPVRPSKFLATVPGRTSIRQQLPPWQRRTCSAVCRFGRIVIHAHRPVH